MLVVEPRLGVRYGFQFALCLCYQLTLGEGKPPHLIDMILALYNNILALKGTPKGSPQNQITPVLKTQTFSL